MKEVRKCSISGVAFTLDVDAFEALNSYIESLKQAYNDSPDGTEIVADIEARIAELILTVQSNDRVVEKPLVLNIIQQLGSAEDISDSRIDADLKSATPRIPRRLYRDTENAKLGGVCAGFGKYFDIDPVWIRLIMFLPLFLSPLSGIPILLWLGPLAGNLFGVFLICYFIMWFAVPAARSARQKLEMNGERITAQSVADTTAATADVDSKAKPIIAETVSVFGKVVLILLKLFAGIMVFGLIMAACALIIGLLVLLVGGNEFMSTLDTLSISTWTPVLGIFIALIPVVLLIYVLMCLIASRKPNGKTVLIIFLLWMASIVGCCVAALHDDVPRKLHEKRAVINSGFRNQGAVEYDLESLEEMLDNSGSNDQTATQSEPQPDTTDK
ncbi:MAG: PspC domain-containing protein [Rikenellaceae bacterium]|nr:PspC domain-containing protein [Rikenellaceae bacterium]